jgi:hypothetical protein
MILVGNQRGGATDLARHLMKSENERVEVHEVRGFVASDLLGAFRESYAISRSTQCKQHLFSLSLSPPKGENVPNAAFEDAVQQAERSLGLEGQPRTIVFHDKRGGDGELRRHAHAVWCRVDCDQMKAIQLSFTHRRLQSLSRELYLEHGWQMPRGLLQQGFCDPRNFTLEEWQQAKRCKKDPRVLKALFQDAWAISDNRETFENALLEKGCVLARGNRRGFVAVDHTGEVYSLSRWTGEKAMTLRTRLGDEGQLQSIELAQSEVAQMAVSRLEKLRTELVDRRQDVETEQSATRDKLVLIQSTQLGVLDHRHKVTLAALETEHASRFRTGLFGLLDRLSGRRKRIAEANRRERERLNQQHAHKRKALALAFERRCVSLEQEEDTARRSENTLSTIASDIEALRKLRVAPLPTVQHTRKHVRHRRK